MQWCMATQRGMKQNATHDIETKILSGPTSSFLMSGDNSPGLLHGREGMEDLIEARVSLFLREVRRKGGREEDKNAYVQ